MKFSNKIDLIKKVLQAVIFNKRTPLFVSWEITRQCNARCKYCNIWDDSSKELDTGQVLSIIRELSILGTWMIHFTGGEALLRSDFGEILRYCRQRGILTSLNSNGALVPARIDELTTLRVLAISIDGPEEVHDSARGVGSYHKAMDALAVARDRGIQIRLLTVLSKQNLEYLKGLTPNPCIICNEKIKFGILLEKAKDLGADHVASGHYAKVEFNSRSIPTRSLLAGIRCKE